jgi:TfoX/Sxy family transcriptional regulator of competence genes
MLNPNLKEQAAAHPEQPQAGRQHTSLGDGHAVSAGENAGGEPTANAEQRSECRSGNLHYQVVPSRGEGLEVVQREVGHDGDGKKQLADRETPSPYLEDDDEYQEGVEDVVHNFVVHLWIIRVGTRSSSSSHRDPCGTTPDHHTLAYGVDLEVLSRPRRYGFRGPRCPSAARRAIQPQVAGASSSIDDATKSPSPRWRDVAGARLGVTCISWADREKYIWAVGYDEDLAGRIRELLGAERGVKEKRMFGGLAFLMSGNMAIAASGQGGLLVRVDPDRSPHILSTTKAEPAIMQGRSMTGWLRVAPEHVATKRQLERWVKLGAECARSLPPKTANRKRGDR